MAQSQPVPFTNKGLVQKKDPALLGPGEYYQFENAQSVQEGALTARYGHQQQVPANAPIVSLSKLNLGGADPVNPRYLGSGTAIFRTTPSYYGQGQVLVVSNAVTLLSGTPFNTQWPGGTLINLGGTNYTITTVNSPTSITLSTSTSTGSNVPYYIPGYAPLSVFSGLTGGQRWSAIQYNAGTAGTPALYFATTTAALRENGAYTTLQKWGIDPPPVPAIAYPGSPGFAEVGSLPASTGSRFIASVDANASDGSHPLPWKNVIAVQVLSPAGGSTGYTKITPDPTAPTNGLNGIYVGMHITISDPVRGMGFWEDTVVLATDTTSLYVWTVFSHPLADGPYLTAGYASLTVPGSIFNGSSPDPLYTLNAAYNGLASTGYDSSDVFHIGIYFSNATAVTNVAVQIVPNYQGTPYASDYYQYNIVPSSLNLSTNSPTAEVWTELVIPKTSFTKIGNAGTGAYNWSNINQVYIVATGTSSTIKISGLFFVGGGGLNSAAAGNTNYDYMYCVTPDTLVLCDDLAWRPAGSLVAGQGIIAFDEHERMGENLRCTRRYRKAHIVSNGPAEKECFEIRTNIGDPVKASSDHPWLVWSKKRKINGRTWKGLEWKNTEDLKPGDKIAHFGKPWEEDQSKNAGWLAGILDGEGNATIGKWRTKKGASGKAFAVGVTQRPGLVLDRIKAEFDRRSLSYYEHEGETGCHHIAITGARNAIRFLGTVRPGRLLEKLVGFDYLPGLKRKATYDLAEVTSITPLGKTTVASVQTSCGTFITGGYLSHNTYRNPTNQAEGNPSPLMIPANQPPILSNGSMLLTLTGTAGSVGSEAGGIWELSGPGSIKIYRRGGTFSDGFYRHVGYAANPGGGATVTFTDTASDQSLDQADTLQFDNDPPVPSNLITPLTGTIISFQPAGGGADSETSAETVIYGTVDTSGTGVTWDTGITFDPSWAALDININGVVYTISAVTDPTDIVLTATAGIQTGVNYFMPTLAQTSQMTNGFVRMVLNKLPTNFIASTIASTITVGSTLQVGFGLTFEQVIITAIGYNTTGHSTKAWVEAYLQYNHAQSDDATQSFYDPSDTVECDAILRGCCDLVHEDFDTIFLAGDPRNTAALYQSKVGRPESFPVVNLENNVVQQVNVGSPSNPINGIASLGPGEIICLNLNNLFIVQLWNNVMQQPMRAPATRGLYSKWCWTKGDNKLWYLAYDGIYVWAGGEGQKVSEQIDYMFKNQTVNGIAPIDFTLALQFSFAYAQNSLYVVVIDVNSTYRRLRFETLYNRWTTETIYQAASGSNTYAINALFTEPDTGNLLVAVTNPGS